MKQTIYAVIGVKEDQSIVSFGESAETQKPMCFMNPQLIEPFKSLAEQISMAAGEELVLAKFELTEVLERFKP